MTVEQFVSDLDELITYVCTRVGTSKVHVARRTAVEVGAGRR